MQRRNGTGGAAAPAGGLCPGSGELGFKHVVLMPPFRSEHTYSRVVSGAESGPVVCKDVELWGCSARRRISPANETRIS